MDIDMVDTDADMDAVMDMDGYGWIWFRPRRFSSEIRENLKGEPYLICSGVQVESKANN